VTDAVELASTRALSSIDRPPKNRSSTMRASSGSFSPSRRSASSSAMRSVLVDHARRRSTLKRGRG